MQKSLSSNLLTPSKVEEQGIVCKESFSNLHLLLEVEEEEKSSINASSFEASDK
jgi:hypothetical protein